MSNSISDFDAAKAISEQVKDMDKDRQQRVLRWVAESLGLLLQMGSNESLTDKPTGQQHPLPTSTTTASSQVDIKTFIDSKKPKSDVQFATAIAYYYQFETATGQRRQTIDPKTLQEATRLCNRGRFKKPLMTLNNAKKQGYLDTASRGEFCINTVGENLVAMTLPGSEGEQQTSKRVKKTKRKGSRKSKKAKR